MKKIFILIIGVFFITSCNKNNLDVAPGSALSSATFWRNASDANEAAVGVYSTWSSTHNYQIYFSDDWSDDAIPTGFWHFFYYYSWGIGDISTQDANINTYWTDLYTVIRSTNVFLANVGNCQMDANARNELIAEVKFIRAYEYFLLYYTWGEVPIVSQPLNVNQLIVPRAATGGTVSFILQDLNDAITNLPVSASQAGRVTQGAALALKARVQLYQGQYTDAAATAQTIMSLGVYQLLRTPAGDGFYQLANTKQANNQEEILAWQNDGPNRSNDQVQYMNCFNNTLVSPTKGLVDSYIGYDKTTDQIVPVDESTATSRFTNRDPRLDFTIGHTGSFVNGQTLNSTAIPLSNQSTGYGVVKYITNEVVANSPTFSTDNMLIRYAEVLLTYAEAKIEANQIDASVLNAINDVRSRAFGTVVGDVAHYPEVTATDQVTLRAIVRNERRDELAFEGLRWFDLKRWGIAAGASGTMNGPVLGAFLSPGNYINAGTRALTTRDYLRPIPQSQINLEGASVLTQNPGY
jgi:starch-binding outer membrane protein, SusD/RagB family